MNQGSELRRYKAGDEILIRLTVEHEFGFPSMAARFQHEDFDPTLDGRGEETHAITLIARDVKQKPSMDTSPGVITSSVLLRGNLTAEKVIGEYRCQRMEANHKGVKRIPFDLGRSPELRFRVVEEPVGSPKVTSVEFV